MNLSQHNIIEKKKHQSITNKLVFLILLFSTFATIVSTIFQIRTEYDRGIGLIKKRMQQIEDSNMKSIAATFWDVDEDKLIVHLKGLLELPDIEKVEVIGSSERFSVGKIRSRETLVRKGPIIYVDIHKENKRNHLGELVITAGLDQLKERMIKLAGTILITQAIQIFLVGSFILLIFQVLVTKHLKRIAKYLANLEVEKLSSKLRLDREKDEDDELNFVVNSINQMTEKLHDYTTNLQAMIDEKTLSISTILNTIEQGIFTVLPDIRIHEQYSAYLEKILETNRIAGRDVMDLLFKNTNLTSDTLSQVLSALVASLGEESFAFDMNNDLLVKELQKKLPSGQIKMLELEWNPIINDNDITEKIIVTVRNVTEIRKLQEEAKEKKRELDIVGEILHVTPEKFNEFVEFSLEMLEENRRLIQLAESYDKELLGHLFRNMHTLKGTARFYNFLHLCAPIHDVEQIYEELGKRGPSQLGPRFLIEQIDIVQGRLQEYMDVNGKILGRMYQGEQLVHEKGRIMGHHSPEVLKYINEFNKSDLGRLTYEQRQLWKRIFASFNLLGTEKIENVLSNLLNSLPAMAAELHKECPRVIFFDKGIYLKAEIHKLVKNLFTHIIRNSLIHGLESGPERTKAGKEAKGLLEFKLAVEKNNLVITYRDDGRGLNINLIKKKALELKFIEGNDVLTPEELSLLIFRPGFTTAEELTDISGRGVGMDAVKKYLEKNMGKIRLKLTETSGQNTGFFPFELIITLPKETCVDIGTLEDNLAA